jgi:hypothetical protein
MEKSLRKKDGTLKIVRCENKAIRNNCSSITINVPAVRGLTVSIAVRYADTAVIVNVINL